MSTPTGRLVFRYSQGLHKYMLKCQPLSMASNANMFLNRLIAPNLGFVSSNAMHRTAILALADPTITRSCAGEGARGADCLCHAPSWQPLRRMCTSWNASRRPTSRRMLSPSSCGRWLWWPCKTPLTLLRPSLATWSMHVCCSTPPSGESHLGHLQLMPDMPEVCVSMVWQLGKHLFPAIS